VAPLRQQAIGPGAAGLDVEMWYGVLAPKGLPAAQVERLNRELKAILALPEVKTAFETQGMTPAASSPGEFQALIDKDAGRWAALIKARGIKAD
jgi:tripartite-type tricarboxylate transporter receptor subunit TctC